MSHRWKLRTLGIVFAAMFSVAGAAAMAQAARPMTDVTLNFDFTILGRYAPYYVAMDKGYYREEGINIKFMEGKGSAQVLSSLEGGLAQFGLIDVLGLVFARAQGAKVKTVAVAYQKSPYIIFSLNPGANITKPADLKGVNIGIGAETFSMQLLKAFMAMNGQDPESLKFVNISPAARIPMLVARQVPAINSFSLNEPQIRRVLEKGELKGLLLSDFGLELYSLALSAKEEFIAKNPELVRGFVRASMRGWQDAQRDPSGAGTILNKYVPTLDNDSIVEEIGLIRRLAVTPDVEKNGYGWFSAEKMQTALDFLVANITIEGAPPKAEDLYDVRYLPSPPILP